jgi:hypothetical protein
MPLIIGAVSRRQCLRLVEVAAAACSTSTGLTRDDIRHSRNRMASAKD